MKHPLSASLSGKNAYYLGVCRVTEHNPAYAACLDKIRRIDAGEKLGADLKACDQAIALGTCQAKNMRAEEELQGESLYFVARDTAGNPVKAPAWSVEPTDANREPKPQERADPYHSEHVKVAPKRIDTGGYADAINAALSEPTKPADPEPSLIDKALAQIEQTPATVAFEEKIKTYVQAHTLPREPGETPLAYARRLSAQRKGEMK